MKLIELCDCEKVIHTLPRSEDFLLAEDTLVSLISSFIEDITQRGWVKDKKETENTISLYFDDMYKATNASLVWGYRIKNRQDS